VLVFQADFEMRLDQLVFDKAPHDSRHLVAVELDDGLRHFDLAHECYPCMQQRSGARNSAKINSAAERGKPEALAGTGAESCIRRVVHNPRRTGSLAIPIIKLPTSFTKDFQAFTKA
jgi:hypothetical protein